MSSGKTNGTPQGRVRNQVPSSRNTASPLTPRLAANVNNVKREPSPRRAFVKATSASRNTSPEKAVETPVRALANDNITPRSSARGKTRPGSAVSTPASNTPGSVRARTAYASPRIAALQTPSDKDARNIGRAQTTNNSTLHSRDGTTLSPLAQDPIIPNIGSGLDDATIKNPSSMFFHADEARNHEIPSTAAAGVPTVKKSAAFFYANGQREEQQPARAIRSVSPAMSMFTDRRPLAPNPRRGGTSELGIGTRPAITSPTLSAISSARSPFIASPTSMSPPFQLSASPPKTDYLNTPSATINNAKLRERSRFEDTTPRTPFADALGVSMDFDHQPGNNTSPRSHQKSSSICVLPAESPSAARKRSATWAEVKFEASPSQPRLEMLQDHQRAQTMSPSLPRGNTTPSLTSPILGGPQSPSRELIDFAADARRERKVLDLEISNSSLLAINRTLEREVKKHKAELKRYRRLSRAGRFSVAPGSLTDAGMDGVEGLPHIDGAFVGRPSSPFEEDVSDMDLSNEETSEDEERPTPDGEMSKEERQRAKDEAQLRNDLRKHRDLLLDTARMNRSLQRCLTWTEDLIKDGKKALIHKVQSSDVRLGGRVLDEDDADEMTASVEDFEDNMSNVEHPEDAEPGDDQDLSGIEAFLGMNSWHGQQSGRKSTESEGTNRDSGVEMEKSPGSQAIPSSTAIT